MTLREVFVKLGLDVDAQSFAKGELTAHGIEKAMESVVDKVKEAISTFVENIQQVAEFGESMTDMAKEAGLTTTELQQLAKAVADEGISTEEFSHSMVLLSRSMVAAKSSGAIAETAFGKMGVKITEANGKLRSSGDVFQDIADHFSSMQDGAEKTALALQLFGRSGAQMIPVLDNGGEAIEEFRKKTVMSEEELAAGKEIIVIQRQLAAQVRGLWRDAIGPLLPAIADLLKRFLAWKRANADIMRQKITAFVGGLIKIVEAAADTFDLLVRNIDAIKVGLVALGAAFVLTQVAAVGAAMATAAAWLVAAAPFVAIAGLIAGFLLVLDDIRMSERNPQAHTLWNLWKKNIDEWTKPHAGDPWWLAAIRDFVGFIREAVAQLQAFKKEVGGVVGGYKGSKNGNPAQAGAPSSTTAKVAGAFSDFSAGAADTWRDIKEHGIVQGLFGDEPSYSPPAGGGARSVSASQKNYVTVNAAEGMSAEEVGKEVARQLEEKWDGQMEEAAAAAGNP